MKHLILTLCLFSFVFSFAQTKIDKQKKEIVEEGTRLYRSEKASWHGTDLFLAQYDNKENIGGYLSYTEEETSTCIFFSKTLNPTVIGTITFNKDYDVNKATIDYKERPFSAKELELYTLRQVALNDIMSDTIYKRYKNTNLNLVPLIEGKEKKVYVLTGPTTSGVVLFGNDYLITFNKNNSIRSRKQLHRNIIPIEAKTTKDGHTVLSTMHSHVEETGHLPTPTDICTLLLYAPYVSWESHTITSSKYKSFWDFKTNDLVVMSNEAFDKIIEHNESKEKN